MSAVESPVGRKPIGTCDNMSEDGVPIAIGHLLYHPASGMKGTCTIRRRRTVITDIHQRQVA
jgi:hypothetical protein